jgi:hypothetical protein
LIETIFTKVINVLGIASPMPKQLEKKEIIISQRYIRYQSNENGRQMMIAKK